MPQFIKIVSALCTQSNFRPLHINANSSYHILQFLRFCRTERALTLRNCGNLCEKTSGFVRREAQAALFDYLQYTRNIQFLDAENMSKNSPVFLDRLLKGADIDGDDDDASHSLTRFLRYHPINEFEPFFESIGLEPSEYASFLPPNLMFLIDDELLLHNYYVLCNYGIARTSIGKIYKEATEVFRYDHGILQSSLQSLQNLGLTNPLLVKMIPSSPYILKGNANLELIEFLEKLKDIGIEYEWLEEHILEGNSYNWKTMLELMRLLCELGLTEEKLGEVIRHHPDLLLERSGHLTYCILVFLLKFGSRRSDLPALFLQFPRMPVVNFVNNLSHCYKFLVEINMPVQDIGRMFRLYPLLLGSHKFINVLRCLLTCGDDRRYQVVMDEPFMFKKWVLRVRAEMCPQDDPFLSSLGFVEKSEKMKKAPHGNGMDLQERIDEKMESKCAKTKFLLSLGFVEESEEMEKALKVFQGKGKALQERFDCLVKAGLSQEVVLKMLKVSPAIINQSKDVIEKKVGCIVKELGYPLSYLATCPALLTYKTERLKLRLLMCEWLKDENALNPKISISTLMSCPEEIFVKRYVKSHPRGLEFWERLGSVKESEEMEKLLEVFQGKGTALQERFNCLVNAGLSREDVIKLLKKSPHIFRQSKSTIERKIYYFVKVLGYPVSDVVTFPPLLTYKTERIKIRLMMYEWLKVEGALNKKIAISTLMACSEEIFVRNYVNCHPKGPEFWESLKEKNCSISQKKKVIKPSVYTGLIT